MSHETPLLPSMCFAQPPEGRQISRPCAARQLHRRTRRPLLAWVLGLIDCTAQVIAFFIRRWYVFQRPLLKAALDLRAHYDACAGTPWWHFEYEGLLSGSVSHFLKGNRRYDTSAVQSAHVPVVLVRPNSSQLLRMASCAQGPRRVGA